MLAAITKTLLDINYQRTFIDRAVRTTYMPYNILYGKPQSKQS